MQRSKVYIFSFVFVICVIVSAGLAFTATSLRSTQQVSNRLDIIQNILIVAGYLPQQLKKLAAEEPEQILSLFRNQFQAQLLDRHHHLISLTWVKQELQGLGFLPSKLEEKEAFELIDLFQSKLSLLAKRANKTTADYDPGLSLLFLYRPQGQVSSYIVPVEGYGLWDMIYGYLALESDLNTVKGIRFYKHQETPGLGGEISKPWFTKQFEGKKILTSKGSFVSISVVSSGKASDLYAGEELNHYVDGISGGTITGKGVTSFLKEDLGRYNKYFDALRKANEIKGGKK